MENCEACPESCSAGDKGRLLPCIGEMEEKTGRRTLVLVAGFDNALPVELEAQCHKELVDFSAEGGKVNLDVVLHSLGGDADSAYKCHLVLRRFTADIRVLVPRFAKSAATLFALGANQILMGPFAELGPLDAQVVDPRNPAQTMSALDGYQSVEYIREYALDTQDKVVKDMLGKSYMPLQEIVKHAREFVGTIVSPIVSQVRPLDFGWWGRTLRIGEVYAERLLRRYARVKAAAQVAKALVYEYPHHAFLIDLAEAKSIGLQVAEFDGELLDLAMRIVREAAGLKRKDFDSLAGMQRLGYVGFGLREEEEANGKEPSKGGKSVPRNKG